MKHWMGETFFNKLKAELMEADLYGGEGIKGEPDLFCWNQKTREWFFAEAKGKNDNIGKYQYKWFDICEDITGKNVKIYRLAPK